MTRSAPAPVWNFVPDEFDAGDLAELERLFAALLQREPATVDDLEQWLRDESELLSRFGAEVARRYIRMTRHTDDEEARRAYLFVERKVVPRVKVLGDRLDRKFLDCPLLERLDPGRYGVLIRQRRVAREIFREENTELEAREAELQTRQQALMGSVTVRFRGKDHTLQQMAPYFERQDRALRREAYMASLEARRATWDELEEIYDELVALRTRMGRNAGFASYTPYRFKQLQRFDYGPETCARFHAAVEAAVVPAVGRLDAARRARLGIDALRPWDLEVDPEGRAPIRPFETEEQLVELVSRVFERVDPRFRDEFALLRENRLLDLMSRKGKAPGGYQYTLEDVRLPFIFANSVGTHRDVQTLLHEGGHAFHAVLSRDEPLIAYRNPPIEFAETASMAMELMGLEHIAAVYDAEDARRARRHHLESVLRTLTWIASIDAFQHWVYAHPDHDREARAAEWLAIRARFAPHIDYSGLEHALARQWTGQGHLFTSPFYYIEYGIAQMAALQIWQRYREDPRAAVAAYREGLARGGSRPLPELFAAAGAAFDLSERMLGSLVAGVERAVLPERPRGRST